MKIGDLVNIINVGETYNNYESWIKEYSPEYLEEWRKGQDPTHNRIYKIVAIGQHLFWQSEGTLYLVQECSGKSVYIIGEKGIKLYNKGDK